MVIEKDEGGNANMKAEGYCESVRLLWVSNTEVPKLFEPMDTFGILAQGYRTTTMAAARGGANFKISGSKVMDNSNSNFSTF